MTMLPPLRAASNSLVALRVDLLPPARPSVWWSPWCRSAVVSKGKFRPDNMLHRPAFQDHQGARWSWSGPQGPGCSCLREMPCAESDEKPILILLTSHWLTMAGALVATVAGCSWLITLPNQVRGHAANPYIGILTFVVLPIVFAIGLGLMPIGMWLSRRAIRHGAKALLTRGAARRRLVIFLAVATFLNIVIMSQLSYSAVMYMEEAQFCGQTCHVMKPEFTAYGNSPHARVLCVECHVTPGATGWVESKVAGTRQLLSVMLNSYPRPIQSAMESNRLVPASETCEKCHWPAQFGGARLRVIPQYADDEKNTLSQTVLMMMVGGGGVRGIHGSHFGPGVTIRYAPTDSTRQTIPWVEYKNSNTNEVRGIRRRGRKAGDAAKLQNYTMQCVDCHNRPTHTFQLPDRAVNRAMALGRIPVSLPFIKKKAMEALQVKYASSEEAKLKIPAAIRDYYRQEQSATLSSPIRRRRNGGQCDSRHL